MGETPGRDQTIELAEEELRVGKREVERGRVVVRTRVEDRDEIAEAALRQEDVTVERVPVGRPVEAAPQMREEDGVLIVPVLEERLVVTTELILKEEIRITKTDRTLTAMYDTRGAAETARDELAALGMPSGDITIRGSSTAGTTVEQDRSFW